SEQKVSKIYFGRRLGHVSKHACLKMRKKWRDSDQSRTKIHFTRLLPLWQSSEKVPFDSYAYLPKMRNDT
ncbi:hypothetical protein ABB05_06405, partial [Lederbergia galactosidilytica]